MKDIPERAMSVAADLLFGDLDLSIEEAVRGPPSSSPSPRTPPRKHEFAASLEHHRVAESTGTVDLGWCVRIYQQPSRLVAQTEYMEEEGARRLAAQLHAQFEKP